jgi:hypothetical protein
MSELLSLVIHAARAAVRGRNELILENLLLRHQLQVALRPKRRLSCSGETAFSGSWSGSFARTGAAPFSMSDRKRSFAGTEVAGACIGAGFGPVSRI